MVPAAQLEWNYASIWVDILFRICISSKDAKSPCHMLCHQGQQLLKVAMPFLIHHSCKVQEFYPCFSTAGIDIFFFFGIVFSY